MSEKRELWTTRQVAEYLGVKVSTVYKYVRERRIPYISYAPGMLRFEPDAIRNWQASKTHDPAAPEPGVVLPSGDTAGDGI